MNAYMRTGYEDVVVGHSRVLNEILENGCRRWREAYSDERDDRDYAARRSCQPEHVVGASKFADPYLVSSPVLMVYASIILIIS